MRVRFFVLFFCALLMMMCASVPLGYAFKRTTVTGAPNIPIFWNTYAIPYKLNLTGFTAIPPSEVNDAIQKSFAAWTNVGCSCFSFVYSGESSRTAGIIDNDIDTAENVVFFETTNWSSASNILALTTTYYNTKIGNIYAFDMAINAQHFPFGILAEGQGPTEKYDLLNTVTHEAGHALGLDHSEVATATMAPSGQAGETSKRNLDNDDVMGLCAIYTKAQTCPGCACSAQSHQPPVSEPSLWLLLFALGFFVLHFRRRVAKK